MTIEHPLLEAGNRPEWLAEEQSKPTGAGDAVRISQSAIAIGGRTYHPRQVVAVALVIAGGIAVLIGWFGVSGSSDVWEQIPYLVSGGIGGAILVLLGLLVYLSYEHMLDRGYVADLLRQQRELELGLAGEFDSLAERIEQLAASTRNRARATARSGSRA